MIGVTQAKQLIHEHTQALPPEQIPIDQAAGRTLAQDILAPLDLPPFHQSGMDGYTFRFQDIQPGGPLVISGVIPAGDPVRHELEPGYAARIFTGAPLPVNADTVVMQEQVTVENGKLYLPATVQQGDHVRLAGAEIRRGALAMQQGITLSPPAIGFLAGMGIDRVTVYREPRVTLLITGNELREPGQPLASGEVYEASSYAIRAAFNHLPAVLSHVRFVKDDPEKIRQSLAEAIEESDLVLLTGGVSVGDFDFVSTAAAAAGVTQLFHRVKQKPGKPLFAGKYGEKLVFGLPGNPSSVITCFYQYVIPAIEKLTGRSPLLRTLQVPFAGEYRKTKGMTHFLKGCLEHGQARILQAQESYRLSSFAHADCLICAAEEQEYYQTGDLVDIYLLPY